MNNKKTKSKFGGIQAERLKITNLSITINNEIKQEKSIPRVLNMLLKFFNNKS